MAGPADPRPGPGHGRRGRGRAAPQPPRGPVRSRRRAARVRLRRPPAGGPGPAFGPLLRSRHDHRAQPAAQRDRPAARRIPRRSVQRGAGCRLERRRPGHGHHPRRAVAAAVPARTGPLQSRPYRLPRLDLRRRATCGPTCRPGRLRSAVARYRGPVLPASVAPGVERIRDDLHRQLRGRLLAGSDPDALLAFADTPYGRDDFDIWSRVLAVLPPSSSRLPEVTEHLRPGSPAPLSDFFDRVRTASGRVACVTISATALQRRPTYRASVTRSEVGRAGKRPGVLGQTRTSPHDRVRSTRHRRLRRHLQAPLRQLDRRRVGAAGQGPVLREPVAGERQDVLRGRPRHRRGHRARARRRARRRSRLGQDRGRPSAPTS